MLNHHQESIVNIVRHFGRDPQVLALILGGSIAHGFATPESDIDVMIVVPDAIYERRRVEGQLTAFDKQLVTYPNGYLDGKYLSPTFLNNLKTKGSEPARYAFQHARILFSHIDDLSHTLEAITRYPVELKADRIQRFYAQFEAWHWYTGEALKQGNPYLLALAVSKFILFSGRLLLAHNEQLYPYHKWFLRVLATLPDKPAGLMEQIEQVATHPSPTTIEPFYKSIQDFRSWGSSQVAWPTQFMIDSEWNWLDGKTPVDDL